MCQYILQHRIHIVDIKQLFEPNNVKYQDDVYVIVPIHV